MKLSRKDFIKTAIAAAGAAAGLGAAGCGSDDKTESSGGNGDCSASGDHVTDNHSPGHSVTITKAEIDAGGTKTFGIQGKADHNHDITLTDAHFAKLKAGQGVSIGSSPTNGHQHDVTLTC